MIDVKNQERASIIATFGRLASLEAAHTLLEDSIRRGDHEVAIAASELLVGALKSGSEAEAVQDFLGMASFLKTTKTVLKRGVPLRVLAKECKIEDCASCFFEAICERIGVEQLIEKNRSLIASLTKER